MLNKILLVTLLFFSACAPVSAPSATPQIVSIHASAITQPWLAKAYDCAQKLQINLANTNDPAKADILLRMGEPAQTAGLSYKIGQDDLLILTHNESHLQNLTSAQVQVLFSAEQKEAVQVWVFNQDEDIQQIFASQVMQTLPVTSLAHLALTPPTND